MSRKGSYAQAKGRDERPEASEQLAVRQARIAADMAPLTDEEQDQALQNWKTTKATMPWLAEFIQAMAERSDFNGRRALAAMTIRRFETAAEPESCSDKSIKE